VICCMPEMYAAIHEQYRRRFVRCFPYAIFYEYTAGRVTVYGVFARVPRLDKWRQRLS